MSSSPSVSNSYKTFTVTPSSSLSYLTTYKIRVTTGVKDSSGNTLSSQYETSSGFKSSGLYVVVGQSGTILTSTDGTTWSSQTSGTTQNLKDVTYSNNLFITVGGNGTILTSTDGITWTSRTSNSTLEFRRVKYLNSKFIIISYDGNYFTSSDGLSWEKTTCIGGCSNGNCCDDIIFVNGTYYISGRYSYYSTDESTWNTYDCDGNQRSHGLNYGNNLFVNIERNNICTSTNGTSNWTKSTQSTDVLYRTVYGNELHIVVGSNNSSEDEGVIIKSSDGSTWSTVSTGTIGSLRG
jgi:hypothetical protein